MAAHNLPQYTTPFIGRISEIADVARQLDDAACQLLTLVGPGGIGKTRLAIEVASHKREDFPDGVYFVALQAVASADNIVPTVASAVGFEFYDATNPETQLLNHLRDKCQLLILDNFEHLLAATDLIAEMLGGAAQLKLLVTSREPLNLQDEWLYHVEGLPFPQDEASAALDAYGAVQLFVERARRVRHDFSPVNELDSVIRICRLLDGMPLGIELAVTWLKRLPCTEIVSEIQRGLDILETDMRGVPARHRSIRAVFDHSWKLLSEEERRVLMGLSVFRGGFRREAGEQVAGASLLSLSALVDKSMLKISSDGRYEIHELQRQYAQDRLDQTPEGQAAVRDRHCAYFTEFMRQPERNFIGTANKKTLEVIDPEIDNVRAAWNWAVERHRVGDLFKAMRGLYWFSWLRSWYQEGEQAFERAVAAFRTADLSDERQVALGLALAAQGAMDIWQGRARQARERLEESVTILRPLNARPELAWAVGGLGWAAHAQQDWEAAKPLLVEGAALHEETGQYEYQGFMFGLLGASAYNLGEYEESEHWQRQALLLGRQIGDQRTIADALGSLGGVAQTQGKYVRARQLCEESLAVSRAHEIEPFTISSLNRLAAIAQATGNIEAARDYAQESLTLSRDFRRAPSVAGSLIRLAEVMTAQGEFEAARRHYQEALEIASRLADQRLYASVLAGLGQVARYSGDYAAARQLYDESLVAFRELGDRGNIAQQLAALGVIAMSQGENARSRRHLLESLQEGIAIGAPPIILNSMMGIAEFFMGTGNLTAAVRLAALVINHPASHAEAKERAGLLLTHLEAKWFATDLKMAYQEAAHDDLDEAAARLVEQLAALMEQPLAEPLSDRELEVLQLVAQGKSNREIAQELTLALGTVKSHLHNIMQKLDSPSRTGTVAKARDLRLL
jgi:predicted ATPase/DNA-binding CsgD family transcriptional regulator